jgi:hypothetical protein
MRTGSHFADDLLVPPVNAVEGANGEPGVVEMDGSKRTEVLHFKF